MRPATTHTTNSLTAFSGYRFHFNGQEADNEVAGSGNSYTAEFWQYDSRLGRRWNVDPVVKHWESPYASFSNCPILFVDPLGLDAETSNKEEPRRGGNVEAAFTCQIKEVTISPKPKNWFVKLWDSFTSLFKPSKPEENTNRDEMKVKGGVVGYDEKASGVKNESKVSTNPYAYVDYGAILTTVGAAKDAGSGTGILQSKKWYETIVKTISAANTTISHAKDLKGGDEFDSSRHKHRSAPFTYDTIEHYKEGKLVGKTIHGKFKQEGN